MSKAIHAREFYVVGGPLQPDRSCYVERAADAELEAAIRARRLCCVFGARGIGKTSLMHRVVRKLRDSRELAAVVDLVQLGVLAERGSGQGWARAFAERIVRELGIKSDLHGWWQASNQEEPERLVEFFWRIVLTNTTVPVTVFVDGLGAAAERSFVPELLTVVERCYGRRSAEPDFGRLNFVLVGSVSRRVLAGNERSSPFATAELIEPADFSAAESYTLALGFEGEPELAQALMDRVHGWTGGHPYLTQKVARGVLRKGGKLEDVERVVHEQVLAPGAAEADPFLNHVRAWLTAKVPGARRAAKLLRKAAQGGKVAAPTDPLVLERLRLSGVVSIDAGRRLEFRNRILKELAGRWLKGAGRGWRIAAAAAALLLLAAGAGYWYVQYLPTADIATLESASAAPRAVDDAYRRLRALPGFAERADRLFAAALERRSMAATTLTDATAADALLRSLPDQNDAANRLLAAFWLRRAAAAMHAEQRDPALLYSLRAREVPGEGATAGGQAAELVDGDYPLLERTLRLDSAPMSWHMLFGESMLLTLGAEHELRRMPVGAVASGGVAPDAVRLTALQHASLTRDLTVEGEGTAGPFELRLALEHSAPQQVLVTLAAPSGAQATVVVPGGEGATTEPLVFEATRGTPLAALADEGRQGTWRLTLVDRRPEQSGALVGWALRFGEDTWRDDPPEPQPIPEPTRTDAVTVARSGQWALVQPESTGAIGTVSLWNLATGNVENDFALPTPAPRHVTIDPTGKRLIAATGKLVTVWNTVDGSLVARLATDSEFVLSPVFSVDGGYFAIAERVEEGAPLYSVLRASDGSLVGSFTGAADAQRWWLGPGARYIALTGPADVVRVLGRRGELLFSLRHDHDVARVVPLLAGTALLTIDTAGAIAGWPLGRGAIARSTWLGVADSPDDVSVAADGTRLAYVTSDAAVVVLDVATGVEIARLRQAGPTPLTAQLADDGRGLVTVSGSRLRLWSLPGASATTGRSVAVGRTPFALDRTTSVVAIGTTDGRLVAGTAEELAARSGSSPSLDYFGHRGAVTAVAIAAEHGVAATGGEDGTVRVWDVTGATPPRVLMGPMPSPVSRVALSPDARLLVVAAGTRVSVVAVADGTVVTERTSAAPVTALAFAAAGDAVAIGNAAGQVSVVPFTAARGAFDVQLEAAVSAVAFAPNGERLAAADGGGALQLLDAADGTPIGAPQRLQEPVRWLDFSEDGAALLTAGADWLHAWQVAASLTPWQSRFAPRPLATAALAANDGTGVRVAEIEAGSRATVGTIDLAAAPASAGPPDRDWPPLLGLRLGPAGDAVEIGR